MKFEVKNTMGGDDACVITRAIDTVDPERRRQRERAPGNGGLMAAGGRIPDRVRRRRIRCRGLWYK